MGRPRHLGTAALVALATRAGARLPATDRVHLEACVACRGLLADLRLLAVHLRSGVPEPTAQVVAGAWGLLAAPPPRPRDARRFAAARLVYDSGAAPTSAGVRGVQPVRAQRWRMRLADFDVRIEPPGLGAVGLLLGQVLPRRPRAQDPLGGNAWLFERGRRPRWAAFGGSGEFALPLPRGRRWTLWVEWGALRARLESP